MSGVEDPKVLAVADQVKRAAGGYLESTIREKYVTCEVCAAPVEPRYRLCWPCSQNERSGYSLADRVGSLVYAIKPNSQTYLLVRNYKSDLSGPNLERTMRALLALGLKGHAVCARKLAHSTNVAWCVVPSTKGRSALQELVAKMAKAGATAISVVYNQSTRHDRSIHPEFWSVDFQGPTPEHALVIDDSWVTGTHAQGVASALKSAGVRQVSVFTVANILDPDWEPNQGFIKQRLASAVFEETRCPWTGGACP